MSNFRAYLLANIQILGAILRQSPCRKNYTELNLQTVKYILPNLFIPHDWRY